MSWKVLENRWSHSPERKYQPLPAATYSPAVSSISDDAVCRAIWTLVSRIEHFGHPIEPNYVYWNEWVGKSVDFWSAGWLVNASGVVVGALPAEDVLLVRHDSAARGFCDLEWVPANYCKVSPGGRRG